MHRITEHEHNFVVEILGSASFTDVIDAIRDANNQPHYFEKNNIYIFSNELIEGTFAQMEQVMQFILVSYPKINPGIKTAVVVSGGFNRALVDLWATDSDRLPFDVRVFSNQEAAEIW